MLTTSEDFQEDQETIHAGALCTESGAIPTRGVITTGGASKKDECPCLLRLADRRVLTPITLLTPLPLCPPLLALP